MIPCSGMCRVTLTHGEVRARRNEGVTVTAAPALGVGSAGGGRAARA